MSEGLYCNSPGCGTKLTATSGRAVVTFCSHIFCVDCGQKVAANRKCSTCGTHLDTEVSIMETNLNPREEWKHLVLAGLSPTNILEVATKALAFHYHQKQMEVKFLSTSLDRANGQLGECKCVYEHTIETYKQRISFLENKLRSKQMAETTSNEIFRQPQAQNHMTRQPEPCNVGFDSMGTSSIAGSPGFGVNSESNLFGNRGSASFGVNSEPNLFGNNSSSGFGVISEPNLFGNNNEALDNLRNGEEKLDFLRDRNGGNDNGDEQPNFFSDGNDGQGVNFLNNANETVNFGGGNATRSASSVFGSMGLATNGSSSSGLVNTRETNRRNCINLGPGSLENRHLGIVSSETVYRTNRVAGKENIGGNLFENIGAGRVCTSAGSAGHIMGLGRLRKVAADTSHLRGTLSGSSFFKPVSSSSFGKSIRGRIQTTRSITNIINVPQNGFKGKKLF